MTDIEKKRVRQFANRADEIAAMCELMAEALAADPDRLREASAFEGVSGMAAALSTNICLFTGD